MSIEEYRWRRALAMRVVVSSIPFQAGLLVVWFIFAARGEILRPMLIIAGQAAWLAFLVWVIAWAHRGLR